MKKILVLHGPNLNNLGKRDAGLYGTLTLNEVNVYIEKKAKELEVSVEIFQTNHEGVLIDLIQEKSPVFDGILINPGAFTHYSYALRDALLDTKLPIVEVHLSDITKREDFRKTDVLEGIVIKRVMGQKEISYVKGLEALISFLGNASL